MKDRALDHRLNRRVLIGRAGLAGAGAAAMLSVSAATASSIVRAALLQSGGTVTIGQVGDIQNLDPFALLFLNYPFIENVYDQLLRLDHQLKPSPALAESYTASPDGLKFTLKIRQGVKYHSGNVMTTADVAANLERARVAATGGNLLQNMAVVTKITAVDAATVEIDFSAPAAYFVDALGLQPVVEPAFFDKLKSQASGTGAFSVKEWVPGDHLTMVKNPNYWNAGRPRVDQAVVKIFADTGSLVSALEGGVIDIALSFPPEEYVRLKDTYAITQGQQGANFYYLGLNAKMSPFDNKLVRQAMAHALDRDTMVQNVLFGIGKAIMSPFPDFSPAYNPAHNQLYPFDLAKAKALLQQAGQANGIKFSTPAPSGYPEFGKFAEIFQADLAKIGCTLDIQPMDSAQWYPILLNGTYEATFSFAGGTQIYPTRISLSSNFPGTGNVAWPDGKAPAAYAAGLAEADATFDPAKQKAALQKMADSFMDEAWNLPISFRTTLFASAKAITGLDGGVYDQLRLDQVAKGS
jgi:peptide/nickel transport system substrate-binding protein